MLVDALVELGRYDEAARALQRMIDLGPGLASYTRASYFAELQGDIAGAREALRLAASAGGDAPENVAYVQTLLGNLEFGAAGTPRPRSAPTGRRSRASRATRGARIGLAKIDFARGRPRGGDPFDARGRGDDAVGEYLAALGDAELAAGHARAAARVYAQVNEQHRDELRCRAQPRRRHGAVRGRARQPGHAR